MELLRFVHRLLLGVWIGALLCFGAVVAPTLFRVLGSPAAAGGIVREIIPVLDVAGVLIAITVLVIEFVLGGWPRGRARIRWIALVFALALGGISIGYVVPRMSALRHQAENRISELPSADPLRREFGMLHGVSTMLMLMQLLAAATALAVPLDRRESRPT